MLQWREMVVHCCMPASARADREIVLAAVAQNGCALMFASEALRGDRDVVLVAVAENGKALDYASPELRR